MKGAGTAVFAVIVLIVVVLLAGSFFIVDETSQAVITYLRDHPEVYRHMAEQGTRLMDEINRFCVAEEVPAHMSSAFSMYFLRIQPGEPIRTARDIDRSLRLADDALTLYLLKHGVVVPPFHLGYISAAHTAEDIDLVIDAMKQSFLEVRADGLL